MFTDRIDKGIVNSSAKAFRAAADAELGKPTESDEDREQRELLTAVSVGKVGHLSADALQEAADAGLIYLTGQMQPNLAPLGDYLLSLDLAAQPAAEQQDSAEATESELIGG